MFSRSRTVRLHSLAFALLAAAGLLVTALLQVSTVDLFYLDTYFAVAIGHLVLAAGTLFGVFAVAWILFQALSKRRPHEPLAQAHFWLTLAGILVSLGGLSLFSTRPHVNAASTQPAHLAMLAMLLTVCFQLVFPLALIASWFRPKAV
jgi:heme/copper-type cytochrome/quinol oxidase subunit 1